MGMELTKIHCYHAHLHSSFLYVFWRKALTTHIPRNLRGVLGRSLCGEASVSRYVEEEGAVGGQLPVAGRHENHELGDGRLVEEVLVRVVPLVHHRRPRPATSVLLK